MRSDAGTGSAVFAVTARGKWLTFDTLFATELVNAGVSLATIRKRLGHRNLQTTLRYAEQSVADAELRAWRRRATQGR